MRYLFIARYLYSRTFGVLSSAQKSSLKIWRCILRYSLKLLLLLFIFSLCSFWLLCVFILTLNLGIGS
jgi:hypothetical protein